MATSFSRTLRSLERDAGRKRWPTALLAILIFGGWGTWLTLARVAVYAVTSNGRLEVAEIAHPVAAADTGRVTEMYVALDREVQKGDILLVLDTTLERKKLDEATARLSSLQPRMAAVQEQLAAESSVRNLQSKSSLANVERARIEQRRAEALASNQEHILKIKGRLRAEELTTAVDALNAEREAAESRHNAQSAKVDVDRLRVMGRYDDERAHSRVAELRRELADIEGEQVTTQALVETTRATIELKTVRSPASGRLGNITALQIGAVVRAGDVVATVVPHQRVHVVANFAPAEAVGRIVPGQRARVRMTGFAWTQYGLLSATVGRVANEPRDGTIRVELGLDAVSAAQGIPIQHGLPGAVEVEVERVAPWRLLFRAIGYAVVDGAAVRPADSSSTPGPGEARR
ncbi:HlyD family efflux transporter periplasmic adaptor subunit [Pendulispora brunnea]|uniref:HlyD family efflux transporter periplasmic adaptor subunit n=1 Tax=Pendulispora brunnea TaxID=2905690 RepID=A0ABZ2KKT5_9BACT